MDAGYVLFSLFALAFIAMMYDMMRYQYKKKEVKN